METKNHESGRGFCFLILLQEKQDNGIITDSPLFISATFSVRIRGKKEIKNHESLRGFCFLILLQEKQDNGINTI